MTALLENVLQASFHGSIVIACVLLLRLVLKKAPRKYICWLWLLAGLRLLMPIPIKSELSLQPAITPIRLPEVDWPILILWIAVACCFGIYCLVSYRKLKQQVQEAVRIRGGWESDRIDTAFILGFIKPRIYIPMGMSKESRKYILEHERTHLDKGDHWIKMIGFLALALHWFNPLVWIAYKLLCKDIEMACDERVVQFMELEERKGYSAALLNCSTNHTHFASPVAFGEISVKERVMTVLNYKKPGFWISLIALIAIAFVAVCLLTSPTEEPAQIPTATLSAEEQAQLDILQACHDDLEAALNQKEFAFHAVGNNSEGHMIWYMELFRQGNDTMWTYNANSAEPTNGRLEYQGKHYALQNSQWIETDAADEAFDTWLDVFRWDVETAKLVEEQPTDYGREVIFTAQWQNDDSALYTATVTCYYGENDELSSIVVENPNDDKAATAMLILSMPNFPGEAVKTAGDYFTEAETRIAEGFVTTEELAEQAEYDAWGVHFRVDDDRLSDSGADVYIGQDVYGRGTLSTTEEYWLEKKVGGTWEVVPTIGDANWTLTAMGIAKDMATFGYLDWTPLYGKLPSGTYRMGKVVRCNDYPADYNKTHIFYSEFTVYSVVDSQSPEAAAAVERCYDAVEALKKQEVIHFLSTSPSSWTEEVWYNQGDYVMVRTFVDNSDWPENNGRVDILVRQDGIGYDKVLADPDDRGSEIIGMQLSTMSADRAGWIVSFAEDGNVMFFERDNKQVTFPEGIGVISDEMIRFCENWKNSGSDEELGAQLTYKFDENGELVYMEYLPLYYDEDPPVFTIEILPTTAEEVDAKAESYIDQMLIGSFSWAEAQEKYTAEAFNIRKSGFVNSEIDPITDAVDAARRALQEYPNLGEYLSLEISHDDSAGMWKVTIASYYEYQASIEYRDIYIADNGVTCLLVYEGPIDSWDPATGKWAERK